MKSFQIISLSTKNIKKTEKNRRMTSINTFKKNGTERNPKNKLQTLKTDVYSGADKSLVRPEGNKLLSLHFMELGGSLPH